MLERKKPKYKVKEWVAVKGMNGAFVIERIHSTYGGNLYDLIRKSDSDTGTVGEEQIFGYHAGTVEIGNM